MESLYKDKDVRRFLGGSGILMLGMIIAGGLLYYLHMEDVKYVKNRRIKAGI